jgi:hypothetical protein
MSVSDLFSGLMKVRRVVAIISILAGAGYKFAPLAWHQAEAAHLPAHVATRAVAAAAATHPAILRAPGISLRLAGGRRRQRQGCHECCR